MSLQAECGSHAKAGREIRCSVQHHYFFSYFQWFDDGRDLSPPAYVAVCLCVALCIKLLEPTSLSFSLKCILTVVS